MAKTVTQCQHKTEIWFLNFFLVKWHPNNQVVQTFAQNEKLNGTDLNVIDCAVSARKQWFIRKANKTKKVLFMHASIMWFHAFSKQVYRERKWQKNHQSVWTALPFLWIHQINHNKMTRFRVFMWNVNVYSDSHENYRQQKQCCTQRCLYCLSIAIQF